MVAGFETPSAGRIRIDGRDVTHLRPNQRNIGMVFQSYALFPNMTVAAERRLRAEGRRSARRPRSTARVAEMLGSSSCRSSAGAIPSSSPAASSSGWRSPARSRRSPQVLLLDEPLSALDAKIRVSLREEIRAIQRELGITTIYVTHDQEEALSMSDRIVVMNEGVAEQVGTPFEIYNRPRDPLRRLLRRHAQPPDRRPSSMPPSGRSSRVDGRSAVERAAAGARRGRRSPLSLRPEASPSAARMVDPLELPGHGRGGELPRLGDPGPGALQGPRPLPRHLQQPRGRASRSRRSDRVSFSPEDVLVIAR